MFAFLSTARKLSTILFSLVALIWLAACDNVPISGLDNTGPVSRGDAIQVALLVPHGSNSAQEQHLARDLENAARMAVGDIDGASIDLRVYPTAGRSSQAREAALQAVSEGAGIILGPLHAESANAVAVAVAGQNVNVLAFSNNPTIAGGNLFIMGQTFQDTANRLSSYAAQQGKSRIVTVYSNNLSGRMARDAIVNAIQNNGGANAGSVPYEFSQQGVVSAVPKIKSAVNSNNADAIFLTANSAGALPLFAQMLPEAGISSGQYQLIGLARWDTPAQTLSLPGVQGGWFAMPDPGLTQAFTSRFQSAYGNVPHSIAGLAYDGIAAIGALSKSGHPDPLSRAALIQPSGFQGVGGVFRFYANGSNTRGLAVATIRNNQVQILSPASRGFSGSGF